jgi:hypothetical protein
MFFSNKIRCPACHVIVYASRHKVVVSAVVSQAVHRRQSFSSVASRQAPVAKRQLLSPVLLSVVSRHGSLFVTLLAIHRLPIFNWLFAVIRRIDRLIIVFGLQRCPVIPKTPLNRRKMAVRTTSV